MNDRIREQYDGHIIIIYENHEFQAMNVYENHESR